MMVKFYWDRSIPFRLQTVKHNNLFEVPTVLVIFVINQSKSCSNAVTAKFSYSNATSEAMLKSIATDKVLCTILRKTVVLKFETNRFIMSGVSGEPVIKLSHKEHANEIVKFIPPLTSDLHKGECGRIGVIGGSREYTGAPYFAAISALKLGADLVYVFCGREAAPVIKSYSPELIVLPLLDDSDASTKMGYWLSRLHAIIIGPGMGREPGLLKNVSDIISYCIEKRSTIPLIIDADGLFLITENLGLVQNYKGPVILTPNAVEYSRLNIKFPGAKTLEIASSLNSILLQKGQTDVITNGIYNKEFSLSSENVTIHCDTVGSNRRCGGQGDILSGCLGTFAAWFHTYKQKHSMVLNTDANVNVLSCEDKLEWHKNNFMGFSWASYGACAITKLCNKLAFEKFGRSTTASDMIQFIHVAFKSLFDT